MTDTNQCTKPFTFYYNNNNISKIKIKRTIQFMIRFKNNIIRKNSTKKKKNLYREEYEK